VKEIKGKSKSVNI